MDFFTLVGLIACLYIFFYSFSFYVIDCDLHLAFFDKFGEKSANLRGKVIWLTGASTALGQSLALEVAGQGGKLALSANSMKGLQETKDLCLNTNPLLTSNDILVFRFDVEEIKSHRDAFWTVLKYFGTVDILILIEDKLERHTWEQTSEFTDRSLFSSNVFGVLALSRLVVRYFSKIKKGKLVAVSSIAGLIGIPNSSCYSGAKHALHGYFDGLRYEKIGENIQATLLCVGSNRLLRQDQPANDEGVKSEINPEEMTAKRCAQLCLTAIVNDLDEAWMAVFPILHLIYGMKYFPNVTKRLTGTTTTLNWNSILVKKTQTDETILIK